MEIKNPAIETNASTIASKEEVKVVTPIEDDPEAQISALEAEKARLIEESANYKMAYLKAKSKKGEVSNDDEDLEEKVRRISQETLAQSRLAQLAQEQDAIIKKALKENKELKLANLNKTKTPPAVMGAHSEATPVTDTSITPEQLNVFKAKGWSDKDIERYKNNLKKYGGR